MQRATCYKLKPLHMCMLLPQNLILIYRCQGTNLEPEPEPEPDLELDPELELEQEVEVFRVCLFGLPAAVTPCKSPGDAMPVDGTACLSLTGRMGGGRDR